MTILFFDESMTITFKGKDQRSGKQCPTLNPTIAQVPRIDVRPRGAAILDVVQNGDVVTITANGTGTGTVTLAAYVDKCNPSETEITMSTLAGPAMVDTRTNAGLWETSILGSKSVINKLGIAISEEIIVLEPELSISLELEIDDPEADCPEEQIGVGGPTGDGGAGQGGGCGTVGAGGSIIYNETTSGGTTIGGDTNLPSSNPEGLGVYWKLNETSGTRFDEIGENHLIVFNDVASSAGKLNGAVDLTSNVDKLGQILQSDIAYLQSDDTPNLSMNDTDFTIAFWTMIPTVDDFGFTRTFVTKTGGVNQADEPSSEFHINSPSNGGLGATTVTVSFSVFEGDVGGAIESDDELTGGIWYLIIVDYKLPPGEFTPDNGTVSIQINNGTIKTREVVFSIIQPGNSPFNVGTSGGTDLQPSQFRAFDGFIDNLAIWKRLLNTNERNYLWNYGKGVEILFLSGGTIMSGSALVS